MCVYEMYIHIYRGRGKKMKVKLSNITFSYIFIAGVFDALTKRSTKYALSLPPC
ncbi:hypothetical protein Hanom_Chr04g00348221 [Helianthus anomalus]